MAKQMRICVLAGDGIGPEITRQALKIVGIAADYLEMELVRDEGMIGGAAIDAEGLPLPLQTITHCRSADAVLLGAVGGSKWDTLPMHLRPEAGLMALRAKMGLYANIRPATLLKPLRSVAPLHSEIDGFDLLMVRELAGGIYFGDKGKTDVDGARAAYDTEIYTAPEIERIARIAFRFAQNRRKNLVSIDKSSMLQTSRLWRETVEQLHSEFPDVTLRHLHADHAAMELIRNPAQFDVIVTSNLFGDILSEEAAALTGSVGLVPSASLGYTTKGIYEAVHGSAPDLAGKNVANPIGAIRSAAMMFQFSFSRKDIGDAIEQAVTETLESCRTADIAVSGLEVVSTEEMGDRVAQKLRSLLSSKG